MRILYVPHFESDYGGYCLWNGLNEAVGPHNVVDWPTKRSYHGETDRYPSCYPGHEGEEGVTGPLEWAIPRPYNHWCTDSVAVIAERLRRREFDLVVIESARKYAVEAFRQIRHLVDVPVVLHDGEDWDRVEIDLIREFGVRYYLKRELTVDGLRALDRAGLADRVRAWPFSACTLGAGPGAPRDIDILCTVGDTHPVRARMRALVEKLGTEGYRVDTARSGWREYMARIARSKIVVAPRGFGQDTLRRWEIPSEGALLLAERLTLIEDHPFVDGVHCALYNPDGSDFEDKVRGLLADDGRRLELAARGREHLVNHHTNHARAEKLLGWVTSA